jgi:hypothetical protein
MEQQRWLIKMHQGSSLNGTDHPLWDFLLTNWLTFSSIHHIDVKAEICRRKSDLILGL